MIASTTVKDLLSEMNVSYVQVEKDRYEIPTLGITIDTSILPATSKDFFSKSRVIKVTSESDLLNILLSDERPE